MKKNNRKFKGESGLKALPGRNGFSRGKHSCFKKEPESKNQVSLFYAIIPTELLRCAEISMHARLLYALLHSYSKQKTWRRLPNKTFVPSTFVSQKTLSEKMNCSVRSIFTWQRELSDAGWVKVVRRGLGKTNRTYLNYRKTKKI
jgi:hypothetical protein